MISNDFQIFHDIPMKEILETSPDPPGLLVVQNWPLSVASHPIHPRNRSTNRCMLYSPYSTSLCKQHTLYHPWYIYLLHLVYFYGKSRNIYIPDMDPSWVLIQQLQSFQSGIFGVGFPTTKAPDFGLDQTSGFGC